MFFLPVARVNDISGFMSKLAATLLLLFFLLRACHAGGWSFEAGGEDGPVDALPTVMAADKGPFHPKDCEAYACVCVRGCVCVCACVRACVRAWVRGCVCVCVCVGG